jgi:very-short-patch-repair endonuclease
LLGKGLALAGIPSSAEMYGWATHLTVPSGVLSHFTAAGLYGFPVASSAPGQVIADLHRSPNGVLVRRDELGADDVVRRFGLPCTSRQRTAIDCLAAMDWDDAWVATRQILSTEHLAAAVRHRFARRGTATLLRLLYVARSGAASVAEHRLHRLLRSAGLPGWRANVQVRDAAGVIAVVDVLFPKQRLVVEVDGFSAHQGRDRFVADRRRQNRLVGADYTVLRVTWDDLRDRPDAVIAEIRAALGRLVGA